MTLGGRSAVVTGASRGIGAAIARAFDAHAVRTLLVARNADALGGLVRELTHAAPFAVDLAAPFAADQVAEAATRLFGGPPDVLVNNAGAFAVAPVEATDDAAFDAALALNLGAPFRLVRAFVPAMRGRGSGDLVTIGSIADRTVYAGNSAYAASKHGARALHEVVRTELRGTGVRATLVSPGPTDTPLWDAHDPDNTPGFTPRQAMLRPDAVAEAVLWVVSRPAAVNIDELRLSHA